MHASEFQKLRGRDVRALNSSISANWRTSVTRIATIGGMLICLSNMLGGCASMEPPINRDSRLFDLEKTTQRRDNRLTFNEPACPPAGTAGYIDHSEVPHQPVPAPDIRYSPGDRLHVLVIGSPEFTGEYVVGADGRIRPPFIPAVAVAGLTDEESIARLQKALVQHKMFAAEGLRVAIRPIMFSAINVTVSGAVFFPARITVGGKSDSDKSQKALDKFGDNPIERSVAAAIRLVGGVRPDADLRHVVLERNGRKLVLDWRGALTGRPVDDVILIEGDHITVGEGLCFQSGLVRPSQITPPGIRIFQSNLTVPANSNAQSTIGQQSQSIPYGTRLLAGLVATNCVGGSMMSNARRFGVLISRNPKTLRTEVIQRSIEELVRDADRDEMNPFLMPDDSIACYDSAVTDLKELAIALQTLLLPASTARSLKTW
jgi:polysaccharide biosynthesis/export protein